MAQEYRLEPKLRFKEFSGDWEITTLLNKSIIKGRVGWKNLKRAEYTESGPYLIAGKHIKSGKINWSKCDHISLERYEESMEIALKNGDIIFSKDGSLGNPALIKGLKEKATINGTMMLVRTDNLVIDSNYFYQIMISSCFKKLISIVKSGSSIPHIFQRDMLEFKFPLTNLKEQEKIASFLSSVDSKIEELEKKKNLLNDYKRGMIQQIFSQEIRFKDNDGNGYPQWKEKKLREVGEIIGGGTPKTMKPEYWNGHIEWFTPTEIKKKYIFTSNRKITDLGLKFSSAKLLPKGTLILSTRATVGEVSIALKECTTNQGFQSIKVNKITNNEFLYYWIIKNKQKFIQNASGSTFLEISKKEIEKLKILIPCLEEQKKIANFLSDIDEKIRLSEEKIEKNKEFKKALLQKMFV